jgi:hypothetical protein
MKKNMGHADRIIRGVLSLGVFWLTILGYLTGPLALILSAVASVFVLTITVSVCPLYLPFGISTRKKKETA